MADEIVVGFKDVTGAPLTGLSPVYHVIRNSDQVEVVTGAAMQEQGRGAYTGDFSPADGETYSIVIDGTASAPAQSRYVYQALSGRTVARVETDLPTILSEVADCLDYLANRLEIDFSVTPRLLRLYERDGTTLKSTQTLTTNGGEPVSTAAGVQTRRGAET